MSEERLFAIHIYMRNKTNSHNNAVPVAWILTVSYQCMDAELCDVEHQIAAAAKLGQIVQFPTKMCPVSQLF